MTNDIMATLAPLEQFVSMITNPMYMIRNLFSNIPHEVENFNTAIKRTAGEMERFTRVQVILAQTTEQGNVFLSEEEALYEKIFTKAIESGKSQEDAIQAANDAVDKYNEDLFKTLEKLDEIARKTIIAESSFESAWTVAKDGAAQAKLEFDLLSEGIQGLGSSGAAVWEEFLIQSGAISEPAIREFLRIQQVIAEVKAMLAAGWEIEVIISYITKGEIPKLGGQIIMAYDPETGLPTGAYDNKSTAPATSGGGLASNGLPIGFTGVVDSSSGKKQYRDADGSFSYKASGGFVPAGGRAVVGDSLSGMRTGFEEIVEAIPGGGFRVYPNSQLGSIPHMAGGGMVGSGVTINLTYAPMFSMADEYELQKKLLPFIKKGLRESGVVI